MQNFKLTVRTPSGEEWIEPHPEIAEMLLRNNGVHERLARGEYVEAYVPSGHRQTFRYELSENGSVER